MESKIKENIQKLLCTKIEEVLINLMMINKTKEKQHFIIAFEKKRNFIHIL